MTSAADPTEAAALARSLQQEGMPNRFILARLHAAGHRNAQGDRLGLPDLRALVTGEPRRAPKPPAPKPPRPDAYQGRCAIYRWALRDPSAPAGGRVYFGISRDPERRWRDHLLDAARGSDSAFHRALREHGPEAFERQFFWLPSVRVAVETERFWIAEARRRGVPTFNMTAGGEGATGPDGRPQQLDLDFLDELERLHADGHGWTHMAQVLGVTRYRIHEGLRWLKRAGFIE